MSKLLLIDGTNVAYRWIKKPEQMLYKYAETVLSLARSFSCEHLLVSFDKRGSTYRKNLLSDYKAQRDKNLTDEQQAEKKFFYDQVSQMPKELATKDIPAIALDGVETDDIIAWICKHYHDKVEEIIIVSSDKDLYQLLIWNNIRIYSLIKKEWMDYPSFKETYNIEPELWVDAKAMMGDKSDNITGIHLVGEKRAITYLKEYGPNFEKILENLEKKPKKGKIDKRILESLDIVKLNRKVVDLLSYVEDIITDEYKDLISYFMEEEGINVED